MKILFIIGNGFDLNLGLKTSYKDFFEFYKNVDSALKSVIDLKSSISSNYNNWADLELAFGKYTDEFEIVKQFDEVFEDLGERLAEYLEIEENKFNASNIDKSKFFECLAKPESYLPLAESNKIAIHKEKYLKNNWDINIVTFNYTKIIETIVGNKMDILVGHHPRTTGKIILREVDHIHGYVEERMVLGVNDVSQLKNNKFHGNLDVEEAIIKEKCNQAYGHTIELEFKKKIKEANYICIFGSSIGETDKLWWELIGEKIRSNGTPLIIFSKGEEVISPRIGYKNNRTKRKVRNYFLKKTNLPKELWDSVSKNIFVALDTSMFKINV